LNKQKQNQVNGEIELTFMLVIIVFLFNRLAELQIGTVSAHSELGKGSCFTVRISLATV